MEACSPLRRLLKRETQSSAIDLGEVLGGGNEDGVLWVSGKGAVGRSREPGKTMLDGGNWTAPVAIVFFLIWTLG